MIYNKVKRYLIVVFAFILIIYIGMHVEIEPTYSEYVKTKRENRLIDFGSIQLGDTIKIKYNLINLSTKHFVISELKSDNDVLFKGTILNKSNFPGQNRMINIQCIPSKKGNLSRKVVVISNSIEEINLEFKGRVR